MNQNIIHGKRITTMKQNQPPLIIINVDNSTQKPIIKCCLDSKSFVTKSSQKWNAKLLKELFSPVIVFNEKAGAPKCLWIVFCRSCCEEYEKETQKYLLNLGGKITITKQYHIKFI